MCVRHQKQLHTDAQLELVRCKDSIRPFEDDMERVLLAFVSKPANLSVILGAKRDGPVCGFDRVGLAAGVIDNVLQIHPELLGLPFVFPIHDKRVKIHQGMIATR